MMRSTILLCFVLFYCGSIAQTLPDIAAWKSIEKRILDGERLTDLRKDLLSITSLAQKEKNDIALARSLYLIMHIDDRKKEDSLFFCNSSFIDSLISGNSSPQLKGIMHMLKGKRIMYFRNKYYNRNNRIFFVGADSVQYGRMTLDQLDSASGSSLDKALRYASYFKNAPVSEIIWLSYNPIQFSFKPGFADIVYAEKLGALRDVNPPSRSDIPRKWFEMKPPDFLNAAATDSTFGRGIVQVFQIYREWAGIHQVDDPAAFYSIEFLARKRFYKHYGDDTVSMKLFEKYVEGSVASEYAPVRASAVEQLADLWISKACMYNTDYSGSSFDYISYLKYPRKAFDQQYQWCYVKVDELIDRHQSLLDSFQLIKQRLVLLRNSFMQPDANWRMDNNQLSGEPVLTYLKYRNIDELHVRIARKKTPVSLTGRVPYVDYKNSFIRDTVYKLLDFQDHQWHNTFIKLDAFPFGEYVAFFSEGDFEKENDPLFFDFEISGMIAINNDEKVFVLDRKTGMPVVNTKVLIDDRPSQTNSKGIVKVKDEDAYVDVIRGIDTLNVDLNSFEEDLPDEIYNSEEYDDLLEFYEDNVSLRFFTDRSLYRPGQMVNYKGVLMVRHPQTGEWRVFNKKNVRSGLFKSVYREMGKGQMLVFIRDPFNKVADSILITPDEFGAFVGVYSLPQNAATGEWSFDTEYVDVEYENNHSFSVEEYKRPSFELAIQKPSGELRLGNNFSLGVKVRSFAGSKLDGVLLNYSITASGLLPDGENGTMSRSEVILSSSGRTDLKGELKIQVSDSVWLSQFAFDDEREWKMDYHVEVEAIDNTGESHEEDIRVSLSNRHVSLRMQMPATLDLKNITPYYISASSEYGGYVKKQVEVSLMKVQPVKPRKERNNWPKTDVWVHTPAQLQAWFPALKLEEEEDEQEELLFTTTLMAGGDEKLTLPTELLKAGYYSIKITACENNRIIGVLERNLTVFDSKEKKLPASADNFHYLPLASVAPGETFSWFAGNAKAEIYSIFHITYFEKHGKGVRIKNVYETVKHSAGLFEWKYRVPVNVVGDLKITQQYITDNEFISNSATVYIDHKKNTAPVISVDKYRTQLKPGESEMFRVSIRTRDTRVAAQLMTTMYDASLDKLEPHNWLVRLSSGGYVPKTSWERQDVRTTGGRLPGAAPVEVRFNDKPVWWLNEMYSIASGDFESKRADQTFSNVLQGRVAGVNVAGGDGLSEEIVIGYSTIRRSDMTGAVSSVVVKGVTSLSSYSKSLIVLDGVVYEGSVSSIDTKLITSGVIIRGEDAMALYGSRAANGLLLLSTKGPVEIPAIKQEPPPVRKNFSETAFFYPRLMADKIGNYTISFTIPESVTEWKWKMLAHTKTGQFAYEEKSIFSQLPLMIQPDMPRFLYQGDQLVLKSRISNLDSTDQKGMVKCVIEDVATGDDLSYKLLKTTQHQFSVRARANSVSTFNLSIPDTMVNPLCIRIIASGDNISDGEEHVIPVLSKQILVSQTVNLSGDTILQKPHLPADAIPYGISTFIQPKRTASLINALPYLANYRFNCTEQTFNKMLAHLLAIKLMRTDASIQSAWAAKLNAPFKKVILLDSLAEGRSESTPWLQLEFAKEKQQRDLFRLLDTMEAKRKIKSYFDVIAGNQNSDGGMSWFKGGDSNPYISMYLLGALGKAKKDSLPLIGYGLVDQNRYKVLLDKLVTYCDNLFRKDTPGNWVEAWGYARSFWWNDYVPGAELKGKFESMIGFSLSNAKIAATGSSALLLGVMFRIMPPESGFYKRAEEMLESIFQQAIADANGFSWKTLSGDDDLSYTQEEWLVKIAEAFSESGKYPEVEKGIVQWLQLAKNGNRWSTTKSTGDVVTLMSRLKVFEQNPTNTIDVKAKTLAMAVTDDMLQGSSYDFRRVYGKGFPETLTIKAAHPEQTRGSVNHYYFTSQPPLNSSGIVLKKEFFRLNKSTDKWEPLGDGQTIMIADKLKVVLTIETPKKLEYVYIEEKRAAGFEPDEALSGYEYSKRLSYYKSVTDDGFRFFSTVIPSGASTIGYEMTAVKEGVFSSGIGSLECMYQPSVKVYTKNTVFRITPVEPR